MQFFCYSLYLLYLLLYLVILENIKEIKFLLLAKKCEICLIFTDGCS